MRRFNLPGIHYVNNSTALCLDVDIEPTITVVDTSVAANKKLRFVEASNTMEETDSTKGYNMLHIEGLNGMLLKGGNTIDFGGGDLALHINMDEEPESAYSNYKITLDSRNTMEEVDSTNHINVLHMNSIKDLFFRIPNNTVFDEYKTIYTRGTLYTISGRESQGVDIGLNGQGASVSGQKLTLIPQDDTGHNRPANSVVQYQGYNSDEHCYYFTAASGSSYELPIAITLPNNVTATNVRVVYIGMVADWAPTGVNIDWLQTDNQVIIYAYDYADYDYNNDEWIVSGAASDLHNPWSIKVYDN